MKRYEWIAGVLWDVLEFAHDEGLTTVERAVADAIKASEPNTGPDPRGRKLWQTETSEKTEFLGLQSASAEYPELVLAGRQLEQ